MFGALLSGLRVMLGCLVFRCSRGARDPRIALTALVASLALVLLGVPAISSAATKSCPTIVFIGARGSGEPANRSTQGLGPAVYEMAATMKSTLAGRGKTLRTLADLYPADPVRELSPTIAELAGLRLGGAPATAALIAYGHSIAKYFGSIATGTRDVIAEANETVTACPKSSLVLAGYSQGAMAIHQAELQLTQAGDKSVLTHIAGTLLLGDGDRVPNTHAKEFGSSPDKAEGIRTYLKLDSRDDVPLPGTTANICNAEDIVCDFNLSRIRNHSHASKVHTSYAADDKKLLAQAANWLADKISSLRPHGGSGVLTPSGRVGPLQIDQSRRAAVIAFAGTPDAEAVDSAFGGPKFDALGYGCGHSENTTEGPVGNGTYCRTVFYIDVASGTLEQFFTISGSYSDNHGIRVGMSTAEANRRSHTRAIIGCLEAIHLRTTSANLMIGIIDGHPGSAIGSGTLPVVGGHVELLAVDSNVRNPGVFDCI